MQRFRGLAAKRVGHGAGPWAGSGAGRRGKQRHRRVPRDMRLKAATPRTPWTRADGGAGPAGAPGCHWGLGAGGGAGQGPGGRRGKRTTRKRASGRENNPSATSEGRKPRSNLRPQLQRPHAALAAARFAFTGPRAPTREPLATGAWPIAGPAPRGASARWERETDPAQSAAIRSQRQASAFRQGTLRRAIGLEAAGRGRPTQRLPEAKGAGPRGPRLATGALDTRGGSWTRVPPAAMLPVSRTLTPTPRGHFSRG